MHPDIDTRFERLEKKVSAMSETNQEVKITRAVVFGLAIIVISTLGTGYGCKRLDTAAEVEVAKAKVAGCVEPKR